MPLNMLKASPQATHQNTVLILVSAQNNQQERGSSKPELYQVARKQLLFWCLPQITNRRGGAPSPSFTK